MGVGLAGRVGGLNRGIKTSVFIRGPCELQSQAGYVEKVLFLFWGRGNIGQMGDRKGEAGAAGPAGVSTLQGSTRRLYLYYVSIWLSSVILELLF